MRGIRLRSTALCAGVALIPLIAAAAAAEEPSPPTLWGRIEGGAYYTSERSFKFRDFTGLEDGNWFRWWASNSRARLWDAPIRGTSARVATTSARLPVDPARGRQQGLSTATSSGRRSRSSRTRRADGLRGQRQRILLLPPGWVRRYDERHDGSRREPHGHRSLPERHDLRAGGALLLPLASRSRPTTSTSGATGTR